MKDLLNRILPLSKKASANQINILNGRFDSLQKELYECQKKIDRMEKLLYYQIDPDKYPQILKQWYKDRTGNVLDLENPQTYNEKIQWLKLYDKDPRKTVLADKYLVRDWIRDKIGEEYLIPLLGVYRQASEIDFNALPDSFVLKANHGSGMNIIVENKAKADLNGIRRKADQWLKKNYSFVTGFEMHYDDIPRRLIVEKYMTNENDDLPDYKFWCFSGKCKFIEMVVDRKRNAREAVFDLEWNRLPFTAGNPSMAENDIEKPAVLNKMITIAEKLSEGFIHVRVDLYLLNDSDIRFGEMTFSSSSGVCPWDPPKTDYEIGK